MKRKRKGYTLKVVEKAGDKLEDILTKSNPWQGLDCGRRACLLCKTNQKTQKNLSQDCHTRNLVYQTWCISCQAREEEKIEKDHEGDAKKIREMKNKIKLHLYIGETSRSVYERSIEHQGDIDQLKTSSHMLRHLLELHGGEERSAVDFGMKVMRYTRSSFERQILESVLIQENRDQHLMNNRAEFNRCAIPRLVSKLGEKEMKKWREEDKKMQEMEEKVEEEIRMLKKVRNRDRAQNQRREPNPKRQKMESGKSMETRKEKQPWVIPDIEKRKTDEQEIVPEVQEKKRFKKDDIRMFMQKEAGQSGLS